MNTITDNSILLDEARLALREMRKYGFDPEESLEGIGSYVNRVRTICVSELIDHVIETRLTEIQKRVIKDYWFNGIAPEDTAKEMNVSRRTVYSSRAKAQDVIKDYLEPLITYFRNLPSSDVMPVVLSEAFTILKAKNASAENLDNALQNIRLTFGAETGLAASALGIKEDELIRKEKTKCEPTLSELKNYSRAFGTKIILEFDNGNGEIKWLKH